MTNIEYPTEDSPIAFQVAAPQSDEALGVSNKNLENILLKCKKC